MHKSVGKKIFKSIGKIKVLEKKTQIKLKKWEYGKKLEEQDGKVIKGSIRCFMQLKCKFRKNNLKRQHKKLKNKRKIGKNLRRLIHLCLTINSFSDDHCIFRKGSYNATAHFLHVNLK